MTNRIIDDRRVRAASRTVNSRGRTAEPVPRPRLWDELRGTFAMRRDQVGFLNQMIADYGDIVWIRVLGIRMAMLNHPDYFEHVLVRNHENYDKNTFLFRAIAPILRGGLIGNVGGEPWRHQRRTMQPSFHRPQVAGFAENMTDETSMMLRRWERQYGPSDVVNVSTELGQLAMRIVFRSLFGAKVGARGKVIEDMFFEANQIACAFFRFPLIPLTWPTPSHRRLAEIIRTMDGFVADIIAERVAGGEQHDDLLDAMIYAVDDVTGTGLSEEQLHREVLNLIIGGYETTSNSVSWLMYTVGRHPEVQERLHAEVDSVLGGRVPTFDDVFRLKYTRMIVDETLRLYTPAWQTMRSSIEEDVIGGYRIPPKSDLYLNIYALHRHPEFWPDPEVFDPDRFSPEEVAKRPRHAYIPFGSGPRVCIGKHFALTELTIILAMIAQAYRVVIPDGHREVRPEPLITLHPAGGVHVRMVRR
ncbi:cytochrome P450 [Sphaerisporangium melleum]|uniref:Cytochrome P450 n=1 Tax=Sphaerisporangium melleum TaxID=321316 RepID=A0A917R5H3_9ACTN|nr:cytochrome P450 [Sphaerisporangium melleum]GII72895.1 cytochrome P450 [Sphaerisporangium melleum]